MTTHFRLFLRLRMSGPIFLIHLYDDARTAEAFLASVCHILAFDHRELGGISEHKRENNWMIEKITENVAL